MDGEARPMNEELGFLANLIGEEKKPAAPSLAPAPGSVKVADGPAPTKLEEAGIAPIADQLSAWFGDMPKPTAAQRSGGWVFGDEAPAAPEQTQSESPTGDEDDEDNAPPPANYLAERAARHARLSRIIEKAVATIQIHGDGGKDEKKDTKKKPEKKAPPKGKDNAPADDAGADATAPGAQPAPVDPVAQEEETLSFVRSLLKKGGYLFHSDLNLDGTHVSKAGKNYLAVYDEPTDSVMIQDESGKTITTKPLAEVRPQPMMDPNAPPPSAGPQVPVDQTPPPGPGDAGGAAVATDKAAMSSGDDGGTAQTITPASAGDSGSVPPLPAEPPQTSQKPAVALPGGMVSLAIQRVAAGEDPAVVAQDLRSAGAPPADQQQMTMRAPAKAAPQAAESFERACRYAQVEPRIVEYTGENILPYVIMECSGTADQIEIVYSTLIYEGVDENAMLVHPAAVNVHPENMGGYNSHTLSEAAEIFGVSEQALMASNNVIALHTAFARSFSTGLLELGAHAYGLLEQTNETEEAIVGTERSIRLFGQAVRYADEARLEESYEAMREFAFTSRGRDFVLLDGVVEAVEDFQHCEQMTRDHLGIEDGNVTLLEGVTGVPGADMTDAVAADVFVGTIYEDRVSPNGRYHPQTVYAQRALKEALLKMGFQILSEGSKIMAEFAASTPWTETERKAAGQALREVTAAHGLGLTLDWAGRRVAAALNPAHVYDKPEALNEAVSPGGVIAKAILSIYKAATSVLGVGGVDGGWAKVIGALKHVHDFSSKASDWVGALTKAAFVATSLIMLIRQFLAYLRAPKTGVYKGIIATRDTLGVVTSVANAAKALSTGQDTAESRALVEKASQELAKHIKNLKADYRAGDSAQLDAMQQMATLLNTGRFPDAANRRMRGYTGVGDLANDEVVSATSDAFLDVVLPFLNRHNEMFVRAGSEDATELVHGNDDQFEIDDPKYTGSVFTQRVFLQGSRVVPFSRNSSPIAIGDAELTVRVERSMTPQGGEYVISVYGGLLTAVVNEMGYLGHKDDHSGKELRRAVIAFKGNLGGVIHDMFDRVTKHLESGVSVGSGKFDVSFKGKPSASLQKEYKMVTVLVDPSAKATAVVQDLVTSGTLYREAVQVTHEVDQLKHELAVTAAGGDVEDYGGANADEHLTPTRISEPGAKKRTRVGVFEHLHAFRGNAFLKASPYRHGDYYAMQHEKGGTVRLTWNDSAVVANRTPKIIVTVNADTLEQCQMAVSDFMDVAANAGFLLELKKGSEESKRGGYEALAKLEVPSSYSESVTDTRTSSILERVKRKDQFQSNPRMGRMYKHVLKSYADKGMDSDKAQELAARTVNKYRAANCLTKGAIAAKKAKTRAENALKTESLADLGTRVIEGTILANRKLTIEEAAEMTGISPILILDVLRAFEGTGYAVTEGVGYGTTFTFTDKALQLAQKAVNV